ncbi:Crp/Fnr family transcriptional regulator [Poseidonocella sedimentorum]|uniref:Cyclic nucleotide-binding protein n=1 Tax=Poseidonocella sedimentorum TaxID=871652 RepID=A0A1I6DT53_9RHOB|nr:Crp/Fnr family transcriptional regulator [Poseidonocella sedimentorum]SFR08521.1 cyclic nucleotide-binding protein [Poseidonocella sedimentorum]
MTDQDWISRFAGLSSLEAPLRETLVARSAVISVPAGTMIFGPGKAPENLLLLLSGTVRVQQLSEQGREIVLYRVHAGESCVLTTACLMAYEDYSAEGIAETEVEAAAIPKSVFDDMIARSGTFREFVFSAYSRRITELFHVIEEIAFQRMDIRIAEKLLELMGRDGQIHATHQKMAAELGTAREVVSRQLNEFQRRGWIALSRGVIEIVDTGALEALAGS